jgi:uncharacterized protein (TIGR03032 family)
VADEPPVKAPGGSSSEALWARHDAEWRDTAQVVSAWRGAADVDPGPARVRGRFWESLAATGATLLVTREYEHLLLALRADERGARVSYLPLPHPSGLAVDRVGKRAWVASTRNPNQVLELAPATGTLPRADVAVEALPERPLMPVRSRYYPGCLYMHDLALVGGSLYANAVGLNAVVRLCDDGFAPAWWPRSVERDGRPRMERNYLQLNSIAAGADLAGSYFTASTERIGARRPGHRNFAVDGRGVVFSGATREPIAGGLTRPHSARQHDGHVWVDNSGYGELGRIEDGRFRAVARLPGWTRGLCFVGGVAFVGTSRVIPRFRQYAPGLDVASSVCGVHALDLATGRALGSLVWPAGNQVFAIDWLPGNASGGLPFRAGRRGDSAAAKRLFYAYATEERSE